MVQLGDYATTKVVRFLFTTFDAAGLPFTLAGSPVVSVYKNGSDVPDTAQVTLTVDFDTITGLNLVEIDTDDAFYTTLSDYHVVLTTGSIDGDDVSGSRVAEFSIQNRFNYDQNIVDNTVAGVNALGIPAASSAAVDALNLPQDTLDLIEASTLIADIIQAMLDADLADTSDTPTRSLGQALRSLRNKVVDANGAFRVYKEDDTTVAWTGAVTRTPGKNAVTSLDPD